MTTLAIETGIEPDYENALISSAKKIGWSTAVVYSIPFDGAFVWSYDKETQVPQELLQYPNVWFHGSIQAAKAAQQRTCWQVHAPWEALKCTSYYPVLKDILLQKDWFVTTIGELLRDKNKIFGLNCVRDQTLFFRPDGKDAY
jgi:hypothetical protein